MAQVELTFLMDGWLSGSNDQRSEYMTNLLGEIDAAFYPQVLKGTPYDGTSRGKKKAASDHIKFLWEHEIDDEGQGVTFKNPAIYGTVLDLGHYPGVGRRTTVGPDGGVYSKQAPEGMVRPLLKKETLRKIIKMALAKFKEKFGSK